MHSCKSLDYFRVGVGEIFGFGEVSGHVAQQILDLGYLSALVIRGRSVFFPAGLRRKKSLCKRNLYFKG